MRKKLIEWHAHHRERLCNRFNDWLMSNGIWDYSDEFSCWFYGLVERIFEWLDW